MAIGGFGALLAILGIIAGAMLAVMVFVYVLIPVLKGAGWVTGKFFWVIGASVMHVFNYFAGTIRDVFRAIGAVPSAFVMAILAVGNVVIGRWSRSSYFANCMQKEIKTFGGCIYRVAFGHPLRLVGLHSMLEGIEQRVPAAMAEAPGPDKPSRRTGTFDGYEIVGSLPGGGSGGRLYVATPNIEKRGQIIKSQGDCPDRVVIKSFAVADGSSLPQIVRESRSLECAKSLGLILDHELTDERFFYIMPYVPGENLSAITRDLHTSIGNNDFCDDDLRRVLSYSGDVLNTLDTYHRGGLWHKDIKPENIIVSDDGHAHVVDLGLVTPLRSAMTLTTHGTEYFRDPEMVRMALKGVRVDEVDGTKFDIYAAGAVLFYMIENTFPSHGGLSSLTKRCPDAVKWIVRRAMTDYSKRYNSAEEMYLDIKAVATHPNMASMKPVDLPSLNGSIDDSQAQDLHDVIAPPRPAAPVGTPGPAAVNASDWQDAHSNLNNQDYNPDPANAARQQRKKYRFRVMNWWTGAYAPIDAHPVGSPGSTSRSVREELRRARQEARSAVRQAAGEVRDATRQVKDKLHDRRNARRGSAFAAMNVNHDDDGSGSSNDDRRPAGEQLTRAQARARRLRVQAQQRIKGRKTGRTHGERVSPAMVAAAIVVFSVAGLGLLGVLTSLSSRSERFMSDWESPEIVINSGGPSIVINEEWLSGLSKKVTVLTHENANVDAVASSGQQSQILVPDAPVFADVAPVPTDIRHQIGLHWPDEFPTGYVVINDHPQADTSRMKAQVGQTIDRLNKIGFDQITDEQTVGLVRARIGQEKTGPYDIPQGDKLQAVEDFLGKMMKEDLPQVGCIVWMYPESDAAKPAQYWVITPEAAQSNRDDQLLNYLMLN